MSTAHVGQNPKRVCVLGAGVIGLATAVRILEDSPGWEGVGGGGGVGVEVTVVADRFSPHTTSDGSGGFWEPYNIGNTPPALVRKWSDATWDHMKTLAQSDNAGTVGAQFVSGYQLSDTPTMEAPGFKDSVMGFRWLTPQELSMFPTARSGFFMTSVQISVQKYLPWLMQRFKQAGGRTEFKTVANVAQLAESYDVVVNCGGLRSGHLVSDPHTLPIRGQLRRVKAPWVKHFYLFDSPTNSEVSSYLLPLGEEVLVGGTTQRHNWKEGVDRGDSEGIWARATAIFPFIKGGQLLREWTGLRPGRSEVRLELDKVKVNTAKGRSVPVIHNYGHGGSGITVHWGCAAEAADLVHSALLFLQHNASPPAPPGSSSPPPPPPLPPSKL